MERQFDSSRRLRGIDRAYERDPSCLETSEEPWQQRVVVGQKRPDARASSWHRGHWLLFLAARPLLISRIERENSIGRHPSGKTLFSAAPLKQSRKFPKLLGNLPDASPIREKRLITRMSTNRVISTLLRKCLHF